ncbi:MAG: cysteine hydrolase [Candidatus Tectomicrobia bacterium]|nr:cysteine hydrolase [Candidatus Tectomicrobia bacterium]
MTKRAALTRAEMLDLAHTAVIVIDVQNDFCHAGGAFDTMGADLSAAQAMLPVLASFLTAARAAGAMVVHVTTHHSEMTNSPVWESKAPPGVTVLGSWGAEICDGYPELLPRPGEPLVIKHRYSPFYNTDLDLILRGRGVRTIALAGVATNVCVETAARDGIVRDYYVFVLRDCTAAYDPALHENSLKNVTQRFGYVISSEEALSLWGSRERLAAR